MGRYTIEVTGLSGVHMSVDLLVEGTPIYDAQNGAPPGRDEGLPARPSVERQIPDQGASQTLAAPAPDLDLVPLAALGLAVGRVRPVHALEPTTNQAHDRFDRLALASCGDPAAPGDPQATARPAGRLPAQE